MEQLIDFNAPEVQAVLDTLLKDKSTDKNIIWATDPPEELQTVMYEPVTDRSKITTQQAGLDVKSLQYLMGHSNASVTLDVYTHSSFESVERAFEQIAGNL